MGQGQRKWITLCFAAYAVVLFTVVTLYRLPAEEIIQEALLRLTDGQVAITAKRISPSFPLGYRLEDVEYRTVLAGEFSKDRVKLLYISPEYLDLLRGYFPVVIKGDMARGTFELRAGVSMWSGSEDSYISLKTSEAYLEDFNVLRLLSGRSLKGRIKADVNLTGNMQDLKINGDGHILLQDGALESRLDQLGVNDIPFKSWDMFFSVRDGVVSVKKSEMVGPVLSGTFFGQMKLTKPISRTPLEFTARLKPGPDLATNKPAGKLMAALTAGKEFLVIKLGGTLQRPFVLWGD
jgi:type II secretion system protein N